MEEREPREVANNQEETQDALDSGPERAAGHGAGRGVAGTGRLAHRGGETELRVWGRPRPHRLRGGLPEITAEAIRGLQRTLLKHTERSQSAPAQGMLPGLGLEATQTTSGNHTRYSPRT